LDGKEKTQPELVQSTEQWAKLMRELTHDIRTPLGIIYTVLSDLKAGHAVEAEDLNSAGEAVGRIGLQIDRLKPLLSIRQVRFQSLSEDELREIFPRYGFERSGELRVYPVSIEIIQSVLDFLHRYYPETNIMFFAGENGLGLYYSAKLGRVDRIFIPMLLRAAGLS
jgi:signal transduction histidine kinase